jgi:hypothetical protein
VSRRMRRRWVAASAEAATLAKGVRGRPGGYATHRYSFVGSGVGRAKTAAEVGSKSLKNKDFSAHNGSPLSLDIERCAWRQTLIFAAHWKLPIRLVPLHRRL